MSSPWKPGDVVWQVHLSKEAENWVGYADIQEQDVPKHIRVVRGRVCANDKGGDMTKVTWEYTPDPRFYAPMRTTYHSNLCASRREAISFRSRFGLPRHHQLYAALMKEEPAGDSHTAPDETLEIPE